MHQVLAKLGISLDGRGLPAYVKLLLKYVPGIPRQVAFVMAAMALSDTPHAFSLKRLQEALRFQTDSPARYILLYRAQHPSINFSSHKSLFRHPQHKAGSLLIPTGSQSVNLLLQAVHIAMPEQSLQLAPVIPGSTKTASQIYETCMCVQDPRSILQASEICESGHTGEGACFAAQYQARVCPSVPSCSASSLMWCPSRRA